MKLMGIQCKCKKGHIWYCAVGTIWTQMPICSKCESKKDKAIAIAFKGLWDIKLDKNNGL
jgi:hypothetical protein